MAKYRLSYLGYGGFKSIDLEKLECLHGRKVTDIQVIDEFTTSFENLEVLLEFLKRNEVIDEDVNKIVITVDKKENGETINKKIYRGENLLFKSDRNFLDMSFVYKWIMKHAEDSNLIIDICNNYIEKYKNAYNRITGSSYILSLFNSLRALAYNKTENAQGYMRASELKEFDDSVRDFINLEFYKIDKGVLSKEGRIERKREEDGTYKKSYRNIHDFIILLKSMDLSLEKSMGSGYIPNKQQTLIITDNIQQVEEEVIDDVEEFLTPEDVARTTRDTLHPRKWDENLGRTVPVERKEDDEVFEPYQDGIDYHYKMSENELEEALNDSGMNLCLKPGDGDLK